MSIPYTRELVLTLDGRRFVATATQARDGSYTLVVIERPRGVKKRDQRPLLDPYAVDGFTTMNAALLEAAYYVIAVLDHEACERATDGEVELVK